MKEVMLGDLLSFAPLTPQNDYIILLYYYYIYYDISEILSFSDPQWEKLNDSQREYAWQGEADDLIWICVVIN